MGLCCSQEPPPNDLKQTDELPNIRSNRKPIEQKLLRSTGAVRTEPKHRDYSGADASKWKLVDKRVADSYSYHLEPVWEDRNGAIAEGIELVKKNPEIYEGVWYQTDMKDWDAKDQSYRLLKRTGCDFATWPQDDGDFSYAQIQYEVLPNPDGISLQLDKRTDALTWQGAACGTALYPGRGQGVADVPKLKIIGDVDPSDIHQGTVGDCWLLSGISALAEFDGAVLKLFEKTEDLSSRPKAEGNTYVITLYDLKTWEPVDITIDERLCTSANTGGLLGCGPSVDGELWVSYLEKACAIHCGGWDKIDGGSPTHAWRLLLGCKQTYNIASVNGKWYCCSKFNSKTNSWEAIDNSPHDGFTGLWPDKWPGTQSSAGIGNEEMFEKLCEWEDANYILACGSKAGSDTETTDGIVDGHAYSILACINDAGGTEFDLIQVRNPWGKGEFQSPMWGDNGPGWEKYPAVKERCKPVIADDGIFWLSKEEFFKYFPTIYLCAKNMSEFLQ
eukprot:TRINITY_DN64438_c0_g1_i1.p1 TRINITY_DN64438_c0_g1~~TRINITY_DN64438_c0_g1_i1.p1  ORF type:complete len:502 (-),score=106.64 TRINITY_DN64438_c0_g1_i1:131-1636(-)